jgi:ElaB/YqjD/DUF883 family membrane-anchored ribosome-binding protein
MNPDLVTGSATGSSALHGDDSGLQASAGARASTGKGHDRLHRFAGTMHRAIDRIEHRLSDAGGGMSSAQTRYGEQARQYGDRLRMRMNDQPLQSAGLVLAAGVLLDRLFLRKTKLQVVRVPVRARPALEASPRTEPDNRRWRDAADARMQRVATAGRRAIDRAGVSAALGIAGTKATASNLARDVSALPRQMSLGAQRLMARSQEQGHVARAMVQSHPWAGLGAVLAASGLLTAALMGRRSPAPGPTYVTVDERSKLAWQRGEHHQPDGLGGMISSRPVTSSVVVLGLGILAGAMLRRRMA